VGKRALSSSLHLLVALLLVNGKGLLCWSQPRTASFERLPFHVRLSLAQHHASDAQLIARLPESGQLLCHSFFRLLKRIDHAVLVA